MDLCKLLLGAVALDAHLVAQVLIASRHGWIDAEEAPEVDLAFGLDGEALESDIAHRALRHVAHRQAGIERRDQVFLRIGKPVRAAELARLVDVDREAARRLSAADAEALDFGAAARLRLPGRGDTPMSLTFRGIRPDALDQGEQVVEVDAVDDFWCNGVCVAIHDWSLFACSGG